MTPWWPGKQVHPLLPSRKTIILLLSFISTILALAVTEGGPADIARLILISLLSSAARPLMETQIINDPKTEQTATENTRLRIMFLRSAKWETPVPGNDMLGGV